MTKRIGRYEVIAEIGRGGFGHVYKAHDPSLDKAVAIKVLTAAEDGMLTRFRSEATVSARLKHRNIVTVHDFGDQDGVPYIVMELLDGRDLQRVIQTRSLPPLLHRLQVMAQVASALHFAHAAGVVHRDVKPANIMLQPDGSVKVMDFGIAFITQSTQSRLTPNGAMVGTFRYMAPEQFHGLDPDARSDIFAYGLVFYELLTGVHPFHAPEIATQIHNTLNVDPVPVDELCPDCTNEVRLIVSKLLQKDPEMRYQSLDDVLFDIEPTLIALRNERAGTLLNEALAAKAQNQIDKVQTLLREALELSPGLEKARELREQIQTELRRQAIRPKVDELVRMAREALTTGNLSTAIGRFESAIRLNPTDPILKTMLEEARSAAQKIKEANRFSSDGADALRAGDFLLALQLAKQAIELVPGHTSASRVLADSETGIAEQQKHARRADSLIRVRHFIHSRSWPEATALLTELHSEYPGDQDFQGLWAEIHANQDATEREQTLAAGLAAARRTIKSGKLQNALSYLEQLASCYPASVEVESVLAFVRAELEKQNRRDVVARGKLPETGVLDLREDIRTQQEELLLPSSHDTPNETTLIPVRGISNDTDHAGPASGGDKLNPESLQIIERQLALLIGPVAKMLVKRAAAKTSSVSATYEILAADLESEADRKTFLAHRSLVPKETTAAPSIQASSQSTPANQITPSEIDHAARLLAMHLGPIAQVLAKREAKRVSDLKSLYMLLAGHIAEPVDRTRFLNQAGIQTL